ncbi:MAG: Ig-like domain-containing protein [Bacteroidales bacterium]|nr:Ig-like domain-containing protein [Bacteroidales bacterium]
MKKLYTILAAAAALSLAGCTKEMIQDVEMPGLDGEEFVICATHEDYEESPSASATPDTRTTIVNTKEVWWNATDKLMVYPTTGTSGSEFRANFIGSTAKTCYFKGTLDTKNYSEFYAFYPYSAAKRYFSSSKRLTGTLPANQKALADNIYKDLMVSYGSFTKSDRNLSMKPVYGGLKFTLSRDDIKSIEFTTNGSTALAGDFNIYFDKNTIVAEGSDKTITLTPKSGTAFQSGTNYFIVMIPGTLSKGFTATLTTTDGKKLVATTTKKITVKAGVFGTLAKPLNEYASVTKEYVDLGLPSGTMWATFNVGAEAPEEYGDYFAWGETEPKPKSQYNWGYYKWCKGSKMTLTKYSTRAYYGTEDHKIILDATDDPATANWGGSWRIPSDEEWTELLDNCTWTWTTQNSVNGQLVTSKTNGKSIFLPAAGGTLFGNAGSYGYYWSSYIITDYPHEASLVTFYSKDVYWQSYSRCEGFSVRPVYGAVVPVTSIGAFKDLELECGETYILTATVYPDNATYKKVSWSSSDGSIAGVDAYGAVTAISKGQATITAYSADGSKTASCTVTVVVKPQAVDLGLPSGRRWASFNVGASKPEEFGDFFAWGETEPKADYSWSTYKWCNGSSHTLTRYCPSNMTDYWGGTGSPDNKLWLYAYSSADDAARANWGSGWIMPDDADWTELREKCTWTWTTQNGISGRLVTGSNGNSIFLPAAGYRALTDQIDAGTYGRYWSASLASDYPDEAGDIYFTSGVNKSDHVQRSWGCSIRPVEVDK